jgi:hypothetical protein
MNTEDTQLTDTEYQQWLNDCEGLAEDAGFRGLLKAYFAGHPSEDYADLAIGAKEILDSVVGGLLDEDQPEDVCAECRLISLIYPPEPETTEDEQPTTSWGLSRIVQ